MDGIGVLLQRMETTDVRRQFVPDKWSIDVHVGRALLVWRAVTREWVPGIERFVLELVAGVSMKRSDTTFLDHFGPLVRAAIARTFGGKHIVVDTNQLGL